MRLGFMDDIKILKAFHDLLRSLDEEHPGLTCKADYANRPRDEPLQTDRFIKLCVLKRGVDDLVEFSRIVSFEKARRLGVRAIADEFRVYAANALSKIDVDNVETQPPS